MQFKVPQNVQREDTIVAFLTLRHLIILGIGGGIDYAVYLALATNHYVEVWIGPVVFIAILTLAVAFWQPHHIPFSQFILLIIESLIKPQKKIWQQGGGDVFISKFDIPVTKKKVDLKILNKHTKDKETINNLGQISQILDSYGKANKTTEQVEKHDKLMDLIVKK